LQIGWLQPTHDPCASDFPTACSIFLHIGCGALIHDWWGSDVPSMSMSLVHLMFQQLIQYSCVSDVMG
jgi:hypothetical protein